MAFEGIGITHARICGMELKRLAQYFEPTQDNISALLERIEYLEKELKICLCEIKLLKSAA